MRYSNALFRIPTRRMTGPRTPMSRTPSQQMQVPVPPPSPLSIFGVFRANFALPHSQHSQPFNGQRPLYAADLPTSSFSTRCYVETTRAAPFRRCQTNSGWSTSGVTASAQTSQRVAATPSSGSSRDYHCTRSSVEPRSSTPSSRAPTGMRQCEAGQCGGHLRRQEARILARGACLVVVGLPSLPAEAEAAYLIPLPIHS